ncbi:MAG: CYTH domain-containing protein [Candidatus Woesearchaeota archaeon]
MTIEVELRSFISKEKYLELLEFFGKDGKLLKEDEQITYYFDCEEDLRIQKNNFYSKIWLKKGKLHDEAREELEIQFEREQFEQLEKLFLSLGYQVEIKWFRKRHVFEWQGIKVAVDYTKGYGYILELEKIADQENKEFVLEELKKRLKSLQIELTLREVFEERYQDYKKNWKELI